MNSYVVLDGIDTFFQVLGACCFGYFTTKACLKAFEWADRKFFCR